MTGPRSGRLAAAAGVNPQTLRYHERRGLLPEPARTYGGHRVHPPEAVTLVRTIKAAQRLGFTLEEICGPLGARARRGADLRDQARAKLAEVEERIAGPTAVAGTLRAALDAGCDDLVACSREPHCPLPFDGGRLPDRDRPG